MSTPIIKLQLRRLCGQRTGDHTLYKQLDFIINERALGGTRGKGLEAKMGKIAADTVNDKELGFVHQFDVEIEIFKTDGGKVKDQVMIDILRFAEQASKSSQFAKYPWHITGGNELLAVKRQEETDDIRDYSDINTEMGNCFSEIYERESQIRVTHSAIEASKRTNFEKRYNCVLWGPPACGKSEILKGIGRMLGEENEAYISLDATSTTEAGAQKLLMEAPMIPPVALIEEIEKTDDKSLRWLLGIMDTRAKIQKTNYRVGHQARNVKMIVIATVNDMDLLRRKMDGALASRFNFEIYCPRPNRELIAKILEREVKQDPGGRMEWIEPALKFAYDEYKIDDPRKIIPICLSGGNALLNGSYQKHLRQVTPPPVKKE